MSVEAPEREKVPVFDAGPKITHWEDPKRRGWTLCGVKIVKRVAKGVDCVVCDEMMRSIRENK